MDRGVEDGDGCVRRLLMDPEDLTMLGTALLLATALMMAGLLWLH